MAPRPPALCVGFLLGVVYTLGAVFLHSQLGVTHDSASASASASTAVSPRGLPPFLLGGADHARRGHAAGRTDDPLAAQDLERFRNRVIAGEGGWLGGEQEEEKERDDTHADSGSTDRPPIHLPPPPPPPRLTMEPPAEAAAARAARAAASTEEDLALRNRTLGVSRVQSGGGVASILYLHIYKSGGTTFCATARAARQRVPPDHGNVGNCNLMRNLNSLSPEQQLARFKGYQVVANEYDGLPTPDAGLVPTHSAVYVTTLRDPFDRFLSHFRAAQVFSSSNQGAFKNLGALQIPGGGGGGGGDGGSGGGGGGGSESGGGSGGGGRCKFHDCGFRQFLAWLDQPETLRRPTNLNLPYTKGDFIIRYFVGFDACKPGECDGSHLARAKERLERLFTVIMFVENYEGDEQTAVFTMFGFLATLRLTFAHPYTTAVERGHLPMMLRPSPHAHLRPNHPSKH